MSSALKSPRLRRILLAYTINRLGTWFGLVALLLAVFDHTHSSLAVAGLLLAGQALPAFVVPVVVARVEASRRRRELSALLLFEAVAIGAVAIVLAHFSLALVLILVALDGTAALTTSALLRSEVARAARDHVDAGEAAAHAAGHGRSLDGERRAGALDGESRAGAGEDASGASFDEVERKANGALNLAFSATFVAGPVLGSLVVAAAGAPAALLIDVASFVICALLLVDLHPHVAVAAGDSIRARLRSAWGYVAQTRSLRALLLIEGLAFVFFESGGPIEVSYVKATLGAGDSGVGLVLTAWGAGAVLGSIVFARALRRPLAMLLTAGPLGMGVAYLGFAAAPTLAPACAAAFVGGVGNGLQYAALFSAVQRLTPQRLHGRLMGAVESLASLGLACGLALGGALVALSTPRTAFVIVGAGTVLASIALQRSTRGDPLLASGGTGPSQPEPPEPLAVEHFEEAAQVPSSHQPTAH